MASSDAVPVARKNTAFRVTFGIYDADGDLVTGATGLDSEISKDAGTFTDCTNEATEIATSSGIYYLDLTSTEMNADTVAIIVKTTTVGAKTTVLVMYPEELGDIRVNAGQIGGTAQTGRDLGASVLLSPGTGTGQVSLASGAVTAGTVNDKTGYALSAAGVQAVWDALTSALSTSGSIGKRLVDYVDANISSRSTYAGGDTSGVTTLLTRITALLQTKAEADTAHGLLATATSLSTAQTDITAIKAKTDNLPSDPADESAVEAAITSAQAAILAGITASVNAVWDEDIASHLAAGSTGEALNNAGSAETHATPEEIADAVWDEILGDHLADATTGEALGAVLGLPSNTEIAEAVWALVLEDGGDEGPITAEMIQRAILAYFSGVVTGGGTNQIDYLSRDESKTRISQRGVDEYGNRDSVVLDLDV